MLVLCFGYIEKANCCQQDQKSRGLIFHPAGGGTNISMEYHLNIRGIFKDEEELRETVKKRKICYDTEPYYSSDKDSLIQIGFQINLYGTFPDTVQGIKLFRTKLPDKVEKEEKILQEFREVLRDVRKVAEALKKSGEFLLMGELVIVDSSVSFSGERKKRPDVTVHIPVFDQEHYGHPVDDRISEAVSRAGKILEQAGVQKHCWHN